MTVAGGRLAVVMTACGLLIGCEGRQNPLPPLESSPVGSENETGYRADPENGLVAGEWVDPVSAVSYRFAGTSLMVTHPGGTAEPWVYSLDSRQRPKRISLKRPDGTTVNGIYEVSGTGLRVRVSTDGGAPPDDFVVTNASELWTLERAK